MPACTAADGPCHVLKDVEASFSSCLVVRLQSIDHVPGNEAESLFCIHCHYSISHKSVYKCKVEDGGCGKTWDKEYNDANCYCKADVAHEMLSTLPGSARAA